MIAVLAGDAYTNMLRLAANLLMTRLLFPEAFGLMLIVNLVLAGADMLTDIGIRGALITRRQGISETFIDTAWTVMVLRGLLLGLTVLGLAYPLAVQYGDDRLVGLMCIAALVPVTAGLSSPYPTVHEKNLQLAKVVLWKAIGPTVGVSLTVGWLLIEPAIWALAFNGVLTGLASLIVSYLLFPARRPRLRWDKTTASELYRFGRWVFVASGLSFLAQNGNSLLVSNWVTTEMLGIFSIAIGFSRLVENVLGNLSWSLLFPVYAELRKGGEVRFNVQLTKLKLAVFGLSLPCILLFAIFGRDIIEVFYDVRYHEAGWMLEVMVAGTVFLTIGATLSSIPYSLGDSYRHMWLQALRVISMIGAMLIGGLLAGLKGLLVGIAAGQAIYYPILVFFVRKYGIRGSALDLALFSLTLALIFVCWHYRGWPI